MIRGLKSYFRLIVLLLIVAVFSSCTKTEYVEVPVTPDAPEEKAPTYTIMLYGTGGGDIDTNFVYNMRQLEGVGKLEGINFRALYKFSKGLNKSDEKYAGTRVLTLTEEGLKNEKKFESNYRMDNPAHLADFIKETKELMPADKYILVFWNHGSEFTCYDKLVQDSYPEPALEGAGSKGSRAALLDDNIEYAGNSYGHPIMSIFEMEKGIHDSGLKMDLVDFNACSMGMMENYAQLKDDSRYVMASFQPELGVGEDFAQLLLSLKHNSTLEGAIKEYVPKCVNRWAENVPDCFVDLACYDMNYMDELLHLTKLALNRYVQDRDLIDDKEKVDVRRLYNRFDEQLSASKGGYAYMDEEEYTDSTDASLSADICATLCHYQDNIKDGLLASYLTQIDDCISRMTVSAAWHALPARMSHVSMGINWPSVAQSYRLENKEFQEAYKQSKFNKATQWYDYLARYIGKYVARCYSPFFTPNNTFIEDNSQRTSYFLTRCSPVKEGFEYYVRWYFDDSDLTDENRQEANLLVQQINDAYRKMLKGKSLPLAYMPSFKEELMIAATECAPINTFYKYAPKIHVDISVEGFFEEDYDKDPNKDVCPLEQTFTIKYADLQAK